jgi:hypothetical protein
LSVYWLTCLRANILIILWVTFFSG